MIHSETECTVVGRCHILLEQQNTNWSDHTYIYTHVHTHTHANAEAVFQEPLHFNWSCDMAIISILSCWIVIALSNPERCQTGRGMREEDRWGRRRREQEKRLKRLKERNHFLSLFSSQTRSNKCPAAALVLSVRWMFRVFIFSSSCTQRWDLQHHYLLLRVVITALQNIKRNTSGQSISLL